MDDEVRRLRSENRRLRELLVNHGIEIPNGSDDKAQPAPAKTSAALSPEEKVRLFRRLFRGRDDVYAVRWESPDGRKGYSLKSERDWKAYYAARPEDRQRVDKETRKCLPLNDDVIRSHLKGDIAVGVYPLLADETCWFLAADFDKKRWQEDAAEFLASCRDWDVPAALERSRSGQGGHIWIFFDRTVSALLARKLGCALLTRTMERRHQIGLDSYDRFFPNQDTMPKGGFGNLIALPLQKAPRDEGNSVFIDDGFVPYPDQWAFLSSIRRMGSAAVESLVAEVQRKGDLIGIRISLTDEDGPDPWTLPPSRKRAERPITGALPKVADIVRSNLLFIEKIGFPPDMLNRLLRIAAFQNPEFYKAQSMRLSTYDKPRVIGCGEDIVKYLALPRGCFEDVIALLKGHGVEARIRDERLAGTSIEAEFRGSLLPHQEEAVAAVVPHDDGVICAPTAFGKTVVAAWLIARRKVNSLVMVHRQQLLDQWRARLAMFLDLPLDEIGQIGGGKTNRTGRIDVAVLQSLHQNHEVKDFVAEYGHVLVDECHHLSAVTFEKVMREIKARYVVGLTATPARKDGHHPIIYMQCGPIRYRMNARTMNEATPFDHVVIPRPTDFQIRSELGDITIQDVYAALGTDESRNDMIAGDLIRAVRAGRSPLLLTGRTEHLTVFQNKLAGLVQNVLLLKGGLGRKQRQAITEQLAAIPEGEQRVILATGSYSRRQEQENRTLTPQELTELHARLAGMNEGSLESYYKSTHRMCDSTHYLPSPAAIQELVQAWKELRRRNPIISGSVTALSFEFRQSTNNTVHPAITPHPTARPPSLARKYTRNGRQWNVRHRRS